MDTVVASDDWHYARSSAREKVLEHLFVGELLRCFWRRREYDVEVLRAEVDKGGYDLVLEGNSVIRHVQLKSSHRTAKTARVDINTALARKPSGCVVWIRFDPATMELGPFLWFGGEPGSELPPLGDRVGRHTRADSTGRKGVRSSMRTLRRGEFQVLADIDAVADKLFGFESGAGG